MGDSIGKVLTIIEVNRGVGLDFRLSNNYHYSKDWVTLVPKSKFKYYIKK